MREQAGFNNWAPFSVLILKFKLYREKKMKFTIGKKLGLGFATVLALILISSGLVYLKSREIQEIIVSVSLRASTIKSITCAATGLESNPEQRPPGNSGRHRATQKGAARKLFDGAWNDDIKKDVAQVDELAPKWSVQENRERWSKAKEVLPKLREAQEAAMDLAVGNSADSVVKGGNDFADKATSVNEPLKVALQDMAASFESLAAQKRCPTGLGKCFDELDHVAFRHPGHWRSVSVSPLTWAAASPQVLPRC